MYGGISRYFANIIENSKVDAEIDATCGLLYSKNHYFKSSSNGFKAAMFKLLTRNKPDIYQKNKKYCKFLIQQGDFDVFHPTYYDPYFLSYLKKPLVITIHDMIHERFPQFFPADDQVSAQKKILAGAADKIIAISETTKLDIINYLGVSPDKIKVIAHGIDDNELIYEPVVGLPERYLLFVGSRGGYKNFNLLADAFAQLIKTDKSLHLVVAGGGAFTAEEMKLLTENGIFERTFHLDATDAQLNTLYKNAICFIFPSMYEGFGIPILEAFKNDCPVILSNCSCFPEIAGDAALYFDTNSIASLINQLILLINNENIRNILIEAGKAKLQDYTLEKCTTATVNLYKELGRTIAAVK